MLTQQQLLANPKTILAVDPGLSGAVCLLGNGLLHAKRDFKSLPHLAHSVAHFGPLADYAVMENVHAMPGQGVCSMFSFGRAAGAADGALAVSLRSEIEVEYVTPQKWQQWYRKELGIPKEEEFDARAIALKLLPDYSELFRRKKDHNTADAILLAVWKAHELLSLPVPPL